MNTEQFVEVQIGKESYALPILDTFVLKPSQYIDDPAQLGDLCRDALAGLQDRAD